jgi:hypothetical protein
MGYAVQNSATWQMQASRTYPETLAAMLLMLAPGLIARGFTSSAPMFVLGL